MTKDEWYYSMGGAQQGPVALSILRDLLQSGKLERSSLVWRQGLSDWTPASAVSELWEKEPMAEVTVATELPSALAPPIPSTPVPPVVVPQSPVGGMTSEQAWQMGIVPQSGLAIASLVCGILGIVFCYGHALGAIPAVICGHMALNRIRSAQHPIAGRGMAIAGLIMGYLGLLFQVAMIVLIIFVVNEMPATPSPTPAP